MFTWLIAGQSNRPEIDFVGAGRGSLHPALAITWLVPDLFGASARMEDYWGPPSFTWRDTGLYIAQNMGELYIGAAPILLILAALATPMLWAREVRFVSVAAAASLVYALGWYTPVFRVLHDFLPGVALYRRPADAVFLIGMLTAILAGYVTHRLFTTQWPRPGWRATTFAACVTIAGLAYAWHLAQHFDRVDRATSPIGVAVLSLLAGAAAIAAAIRLLPVRPAGAALALVGVTVLDLAWANGPSTSSALPPEHYDVLRPDSRNETIALLKKLVADNASPTRRDRVELTGLGFHWPNASLTHKLENTLGYNPVRLGLYSQATGAEDTVGLPEQRKFSPLFPSYRSQLADLLGLRWIATGVPVEQIDKRLAPGDLKLVARTADGYVYENERAMPRVLFATQARAADFEAMLMSGQWPPADLARTVLLETPAMIATTPRRDGSVSIARYANTEVVIDADSPDGGLVVLNDIFHPWWGATVDGKPVPVMRANVLFRAVAVPPGRHVVRFTFQPFRGALASLAARLSQSGPAHASRVPGDAR